MARFVVILFFSFISVAVWASESDFQKIDQDVLAIDRQMASYSETQAESSRGDTLINTLYYWGSDGRIRKVIETTGSEREYGSVTSRYYRDCHLMLVRVAPGDPLKVRNPASIEKYYFRKGKVIRVTLGGEVKAYGADQTGYLQRTLFVEPEKCFQPK